MASARKRCRRWSSSTFRAAMPTSAASSPAALRRCRSIWKKRSCPCTKPSAQARSARLPAVIVGTPSASRAMVTGAERPCARTVPLVCGRLPASKRQPIANAMTRMTISATMTRRTQRMDDPRTIAALCLCRRHAPSIVPTPPSAVGRALPRYWICRRRAVPSLRDDAGPGGAPELGRGQGVGAFQFLRRQPVTREAVGGAERVDHPVDDLGARKSCLAAQRVHALGRTLRGLVRQLFAPDPQDLEHLRRVDVVGHRYVVEDGSAATGLRGARDLSGRRGDVVERLVPGIDAEPLQCIDHPTVHELVRFLEAHARDQRVRRVQRIRDGVAGFDEHRAAAADPPHHLDAVPGRAFGIDLVAQGLETPDHDARRRPFPDPERRRPAARGNFVGQDLVDRHVQGGRLRRTMDQAPLVVITFGAAHGLASRARWTATAIDSGETPYMPTCGPSVARTAAASSSPLEVAGKPSSAMSIRVNAVSGSRKKSPLIRTPDNLPSRTARSATTSLPPGILYSPCIARLSPLVPQAQSKDQPFTLSVAASGREVEECRRHPSTSAHLSPRSVRTGYGIDATHQPL